MVSITTIKIIFPNHLINSSNQIIFIYVARMDVCDVDSNCMPNFYAVYRGA
jgi:hypothetical protein